MSIRKSLLGLAATGALVVVGSGCGGGDSTPAPSGQEKVLKDVKSYVSTNLDDLVSAAAALQAAAPAADDDGWNTPSDAAALTSMKAAWRKARLAYEHVEGAIAVLFPELDVSTDQRYDAFLDEDGPDEDLFDDKGVTGVHAIERILWADSIRPEVVAFEKTITGYKAAAFPASRAEAEAFKNKLCKRLVDDVTTMRSMFAPLALDAAAAYRGVIGSIAEQVEKTEKASTGEEESRYANETLADMRANLAGGVATIDAFKSLLLAQPGGADLDAKIRAGLKRLGDAYDAFPGNALPPTPATWSSATPSAADLATDFGKLYQLLKHESDEEAEDSLAGVMNKAADAMKIPVLPE